MLPEKEARDQINTQKDKYTICKMQYEKTSYTAKAKSVNGSNESIFIHDRYNCGLALHGDTVIVEKYDLADSDINKSAINSKEKRGRVVCVLKREEPLRGRQFICIPDEYEPCLLQKPLDTKYLKDIHLWHQRE